MLKIALPALAVAIVGVLGLVIATDSSPGRSAESPARPATRMFAPGRVEAASEEIELRPILRDRVAEIPVHEGDIVECGALLLRLDGATQRHEHALAEAEFQVVSAELEQLENGARREEIREAQSEMRAVEAQLSGVRDRWTRTNALRQKGAASQQNFVADTAELNMLLGRLDASQARLDLLNAPPRDDELHRARARVAVAHARRELARRQSERTALYAPRRGQVLKVHAEVGELAGPDSVEPAVIFADTTTLAVRAFVEELDAPRVGLGMAATISADGLPGAEFHGRVTRLAPRMSQKRIRTDDPAEQYDGKVREVWIELDESGPLIVGLRVDVAIELDAALPRRKGLTKE